MTPTHVYTDPSGRTWPCIIVGSPSADGYVYARFAAGSAGNVPTNRVTPTPVAVRT